MSKRSEIDFVKDILEAITRITEYSVVKNDLPQITKEITAIASSDT